MDFWDKYFSDLPSIHISDTKEVVGVPIQDFVIVFCAHYDLDPEIDVYWLAGRSVRTYNLEKELFKYNLETSFFVYSEDYGIITKEYYEWCCEEINFEYLKDKDYIRELRMALMIKQRIAAKVLLYISLLIYLACVTIFIVNSKGDIDIKSKRSGKFIIILCGVPVFLVFIIPLVIVKNESTKRFQQCKKRMIEQA